MILNIIPGVEVTVTVNGQPLPEYTDSDAKTEKRTAACYIEAKSNQQFKICIKISKGSLIGTRGDSVSFCAHADGEYIGGIVLTKNEFKFRKRRELIHGCQLDEYQNAPLLFSTLETADDQRMFKDEPHRTQHLGCICVNVFHGFRRGRQSFTAPKAVVTSPNILSEKALKGRGLSHRIAFAAPIEREAVHHGFEYVDPAQEPAKTFLFYYRAIDVLKSMLLIPRTPTPPPLEDRPPGSLTHEETLELQGRARTQVKVKREEVDDNPRPRKAPRTLRTSTHLEIDDNGELQETQMPVTLSSGSAPGPVIELD